MSESVDNNETVSLDKETRKVRVLLDPSPTVVQKDEQIKALVAENARKEQLIQSMLIADKAKLEQESKQKEIERAERVNSPLPPPVGGDTATLDQNDLHCRRYPLDVENSDIIDFIRGKNEIDVLEQTKAFAQQGNKGCERALKTISKRSFRKGFDFQYEGNSLLFNKQPKVINEFDTEETKRAKENWNAKWLKNRIAFRDMNGSGDA